MFEDVDLPGKYSFCWLLELKYVLVDILQSQDELPLRMVKTSVNMATNSPFQHYIYMDNLHLPINNDIPGLELFTIK